VTDDIQPTPPQPNVSIEVLEAADPYYEPYFCDQIIKMAEDMQFPEQWADAIGVNEMVMLGWIQTFPAFADAYYSAMTKLRSAFTGELVSVARGKSLGEDRGKPDATIYTLLAKKRFADLYGDAIPQIIHSPVPQTLNTVQGDVIDGQVIDDMAAEDLRKEIKVLRDRHGLG